MCRPSVVLVVGPLVFALAMEPGSLAAQSVSPVVPAPNNPQAIGRPQLRQLSNVPDDIGSQLFESDTLEDALFPVGPLAPLHRFWDRANKHLRHTVRLDLGMNYTAVYQRADTVAGGPRDASGGDFDFFGRWHLTGCEDRWPGALVFNSENRHRFSQVPPNDLNTGTVGGTIVTFGVQDFSLPQLYWEQGSFKDGLTYRLGKMDPSLIYDGGRYVSSNYAFLGPAFSDTLPMALPGAGLGFAGAVYPTGDTYIIGGIHDANGKRTTAGFDTFFGDAEYFSAVELGWFPNPDSPREGMYHLTFWNVDPRRQARRPSDWGVATTLEQPLGTDGEVIPFLRYAYADRGLNGVRQNLAVGLGFENVCGQNDDLVAVAAAWQEPANRSLRDQYVVETFYRFFLTPNTHVTPDIQVVINPANAGDKNAVTLLGLRVRTLF